MSRLDSFIRRLQAQRSLLDWAAGILSPGSGLILEIGLGNGRTYDHLREKLPDREIYAFDRANNANPRSVPPADRLVLGEFAESLPAFARQHPAAAVLIHYDAGLGDPEANARQVRLMSRLIPPLAAAGALILSDQRLDNPQLQPQPVPVALPPDRYFIFTCR